MERRAQSKLGISGFPRKRRANSAAMQQVRGFPDVQTRVEERSQSHVRSSLRSSEEPVGARLHYYSNYSLFGYAMPTPAVICIESRLAPGHTFAYRVRL